MEVDFVWGRFKFSCVPIAFLLWAVQELNWKTPMLWTDILKQLHHYQALYERYKMPKSYSESVNAGRVKSISDFAIFSFQGSVIWFLVYICQSTLMRIFNLYLILGEIWKHDGKIQRTFIIYQGNWSLLSYTPMLFRV